MRKGAVPEKIRKLIPLLGSDKDGEVVNTARAIQKALKSAGMDWHDLAAAIVFAPSVRIETFDLAAEVERRAAERAAANKAAAERVAEELRRSMEEFAKKEAKRRQKVGEDILARVYWCARRRNRLTAEDRSFLFSITPHSKSRGKFRLDAPQLQRLNDIAARLMQLEEAA